MKKSINFAPYLFALILPTFPGISNNLLHKPGVALNWVLLSFILFGFWHLNEKLLSVSGNGFVKWGSLILGISLFIFFIIALDYYVLHLLLSFTGLSPLDFGMRFFLTTLLSSFVIEAIKWTKAREQSKLENLILQAENIETQFDLLIQQVNPDFLFHSLTTLETIVDINPSQAEEYILKLADVYRQTLKKERSTVTLQEELDFLRSYLFLMMYGQEDTIFFDESVSDQSLSYHLPAFSLQLLGENCIKHNLSSQNQPLHIHLFQKDAKSITMTNTYQPKTRPTQSFGARIDNLKMRYAFAGIEDGVTIEQNETTYSTTIQLF